MPTVSLDVTRSGWGGDIRQIEGAIISLQEYLFWILQVLDSGNVKYLNTNKTVIRSEDRTTLLDGSQIKMLDDNDKKRLVMGYNPTSGEYEFELSNAAGAATVTIDSIGNAVFKGKITASDIEGGTITGASIESNSTIDVETDLRVGDNIYIGEENEASGTEKNIQFFDGEVDSQKARIEATMNGSIADLTIKAAKITLSAVDGVYDWVGNPYLYKGYTGMYVTVGGVRYPIEFD